MGGSTSWDSAGFVSIQSELLEGLPAQWQGLSVGLQLPFFDHHESSVSKKSLPSACMIARFQHPLKHQDDVHGGRSLPSLVPCPIVGRESIW